MKQKNRSEYTPILLKNKYVTSIKSISTRIIVLLLILLLGAVFIDKFFLRLYLTDIENKYINQKTDYSGNHTVNDYCAVISDNYKFDCFPRGKADQESCEERNCCWSPNTLNSQVPWCYYPSNYSNYKVINATKSVNGIKAYFNLTTNTNYKDDIKMLCMSISFQTEQRLRIKVINLIFPFTN